MKRTVVCTMNTIRVYNHQGHVSELKRGRGSRGKERSSSVNESIQKIYGELQMPQFGSTQRIMWVLILGVLFLIFYASFDLTNFG